MKELVRDLQSLGLDTVTTYIQSGNAVFQSSENIRSILEAELARLIESRHGFKPGVLILNADRLKHAVKSNPFPDAEETPHSLHLFLLASKATTPDIKSIAEAKSPSERFRLTDRAYYLHAPDRIGRSKLAGRAENFSEFP